MSPCDCGKPRWQQKPLCSTPWLEAELWRRRTLHDPLSMLLSMSSCLAFLSLCSRLAKGHDDSTYLAGFVRLQVKHWPEARCHGEAFEFPGMKYEPSAETHPNWRS